MEQRTDDWLAWRRRHVCASEAPIIMGVSPYATITDWWRDKMNLPPLKVKNTFAMDRGNLLEPIARARYSLLTGHSMSPALYENQFNPLFGASMDGANPVLKKGLEIKYVGKVDWEGVLQGFVPAKYQPQLQAQFYCTGFETIDYFSYYLPPEFAKNADFFHRGLSRTIVCTPDLPYICEFVQRGEFYWDFVKRGVEPPCEEKPKRKKKST